MYRIFYIAFLLITTVVNCQIYKGSIIRVIDGDTFVFQTEEGSLKIRMNGIDAPESKQDYGQESKQFIEKYLNQPSIVKASGVDKYGRTIGTLYVNDIDINLESIKNGCAWHYKKYSSDVVYSNAELSAKKELKGLWKNSNAVAPWVFRKLH